MTRLDKFLSDAGEGTRSEVKAMIRKGIVCINGVTAVKPEQKIDPVEDQVEVNGRVITLRGTVCYLLHKPAGYVTATKDNFLPTVMELVPKVDDLFPVGRLDRDTEGLLLITNDGGLAHRLLSPRRHVDKTYLARLDRPVDESFIPLFAQGLDIGDDKLTLPAVLEPLPDSYAKLTIHEGRFHQVKRMFHAAGREVLYLKRISFGPLSLSDDMEKGDFRELTADELKSLVDCTR